jgi:hypothetical protein
MKVLLLDWQGHFSDYDAPFVERLDGVLPPTLQIGERQLYVALTDPVPSELTPVPTRIFRNTGLRRRDVATGFLIPVYREYRAGLCEQLSGIVEAKQPHDAVGALYLVRAADDRVFAFDGSHCLRNGTCPNIGDRVYFGAAANGRAGWVSAHRVSDDDAQLLNARVARAHAAEQRATESRD